MSDPLWYKDAILYQLHVKSFFDSNDDGIGDFAGLTAKLDYVQSLGVTALWLLPFYPSPQRDDGYDIADYRDVHPNYGTMRDFRQFVRAAHERGLKVITELVINHTSDQHPWFQKARRARQGSSARDFYVWSATDQKYAGTRIIFTDTEGSNWSWDPVAESYYWHRFFSHQPDLNFDNPRVVDAVIRTMGYWLEMGVDGLRLDAIPYLFERDGTNNENLPETHDVIRKIRAALDSRFDDRMLLAEANQWPEDVRPYFGSGDECHMAFHFPLMPRIYMALAQEDRHPVTDIMRQTPTIPDNCQWAIFLRNHDELTLEMVSDRERDYLWKFYATDPRAKLNLGIRRRLAPLLDNDRRKIELLNALLMSMPGTPIVYYGDEIGMGDNLYLGDRNGVRTPDAMVARPQRGLLARRPGQAVPAGDHGPGLRLRRGERRGAVALFGLAAQLDAPADRGAAQLQGVRARHHHLPVPLQPQGDGLSARIRGRDHPVRGQLLARAAGRGARPSPPIAAACRWSCWARARSRRSESCLTSSPCRATASTGSSLPRRPRRRNGTRRWQRLCPS